MGDIFHDRHGRSLGSIFKLYIVQESFELKAIVNFFLVNEDVTTERDAPLIEVYIFGLYGRCSESKIGWEMADISDKRSSRQRKRKRQGVLTSVALQQTCWSAPLCPTCCLEASITGPMSK